MKNNNHEPQANLPDMVSDLKHMVIELVDKIAQLESRIGALESGSNKETEETA